MMTAGAPWKSPAALAGLAVVFYLTFSMGAIIGAHASVNDTMTYEDGYGNLTDAQTDVRENFTEDTDGLVDEAVAAGTASSLSGAFTAALYGYDFGYAYPEVARVNGYAAPSIVLGALGYSLAQLVQTLRREL